ncbi:hypothetical protein JCM11251_000620 [Rhodosporidiobolus azoricus]
MSCIPSSSSSDIVLQRRGSAASSVSITIQTTTTSTTASPGEARAPTQTSTVTPCAGRPASPPVERAIPCLPLLPTINLASAAAAKEYRFPPPPPYSFPPATPTTAATVTPLSFFPFSSLAAVSSTRPPTGPPPVLTAASSGIAAPPPAYQETPRTAAERCFWWGFLCPFVWLAGVFRLLHSERPAGFGSEKGLSPAAIEQGLAAQVEMAQVLGEASVWSGHPAARLSPSVEESLRLWRDEEILWAKRCAWALAAMLGVALMAGVIAASLLGKI